MSDRRKSTPPTVEVPPELRGRDHDPPAESLPLAPDPPDIEDVPLRETWAYKVRPADRAAVEHLCASVLELARDVAGGPDPGYAETFAASAVDLRSVETYLRVVGAAEGDDLDREQRRLADMAEQVAPAVGEIARQIEAAVAAAPRLLIG